jgi:lipid A 3-O-deacylase
VGNEHFLMRRFLSLARPAPACIRAGAAIAVAASLAVAAPPAVASEDQEPDVPAETMPAETIPAEVERGVFTFQYENDMLAGIDRDYTSGVRLSYTSPRLREQIPWAATALQWLYPFDPGADARLRVSVGQNMYTPGDIEVRELIPDDRPYAGWLYAGIALNIEANQDFLGRRFDTLDTLEVELGVVGPASLAEETQTFVHDLIGSPEPKGWGNQLRNEPGVLIVLERKLRPPPLSWGRLQTDAIPSLSVSLGNVETSASLGGIVRLGQGLEVDFGPPMIRPNLAGRTFFERAPRRLNWYVFAGAEGRLVAQDIFLDGNTFRDSHRVDKKHVVGNFQAGAAATYQNVRLTFSYVLRTLEFDGQDSPDRFGAISVSYRF